MRNKKIIKNNLDYIFESIELIEERFKSIKEPDDFMLTPLGVTQLDSIAMRLQAIGETIKSIDKHNPEIISKYNNIDWVEIIKMRDLISHHYFHINHEEIFNTCKNDIPQLKTVIEQIIKEFNT